MRAALTVLFSALFSSFCIPATIYVPDNYPTIQDAINASVNGDTIVVRPGTYVENIDFVGKAVTVQSEQGFRVTAIDGNQAGSVVTFNSAESASSVLDGFTVKKGNATDGGGVFCSSSSPTIINNSIRGSDAQYCGGGIYCTNSSPTITNNTISGNIANEDGGGIYCSYSSPIIKNNAIVENTARDDGGGIFCHTNSFPTIMNNTISGNSSDSYGGGIASRGNSSDPIISNNIITGNSARGNGVSKGGGIYISGSASIINNVIAGNNSNNKGGGIYVYSSSSTKIRNNIITGNTAEGSDGCGGGAYFYISPLTLANNTITENKSSYIGGGICTGFSPPVVVNTILWSNSSPTDPEISPSKVKVICSDVKGGWPGQGNIDAAPLFFDSNNEDFHLTWISPCRNAGYNHHSLPDNDFDGDPRIAGGTVDMGADEFYYHLYSYGDCRPGGSVDINVVGVPGFSTLLALGTGIQDPPSPTPHGDLWLKLPLSKSWQLGAIPATGILTHAATVPSGWPSGSTHAFQALVGPWGGVGTGLTNVMMVEVE